MCRAVVITTINGPDHGSIPAWTKLYGSALFIVGDDKTPKGADWGAATYLSPEDCDQMFPHLVIGRNNYARKNFGYLAALKAGYEEIFDTDDDNYPLEMPALVECQEVGGETPWVDPWSRLLVSPTKHMARGLPLHGYTRPCLTHQQPMPQTVHHFACEGDPDQSAVSRLLNAGQPEPRWTSGTAYALHENVWSPWNSQSTLWTGDFDLMYIPWTCPFRVTDILRAWIALPCLWGRRRTVAFREPAVRQERNEHDLVRDLESELELYGIANVWPKVVAGCTNPESIMSLCNLKLCRADGRTPLCTGDDLRAMQEFRCQVLSL